MLLQAIKPRKALNKAYLKLKCNRHDIEKFKANLIELLDRSAEGESEEFHKNLVADFLKNTYYHPNNFINTKGRKDLVIYNGKDSKSSVGVIIEAKKPTNKTEMLSLNNINVKAFHELILYYLRERISENNLDLKYLIATNINEWFVFEAHLFEKLFTENKNLVKQFSDFEAGRLGGKTTDFFYNEIAKPFVKQIKQEILFTHFDLRDYEKPLKNKDKADDTKLIALFKLFSPAHLLKLPFANDSNTLDKRFYGELLHIIGLTETKQGGKKVIERKPEKERNTGSLIENAIIQLESLDKISRLSNPNKYGDTHNERLFAIGLELCITWINRILFLKLLEAQLLKYHKHNKDYAFLNLKKIHNYDDLNTLFFQVLAKKHEDRNIKVQEVYNKVPYLNSSLFEPTETEHNMLLISNLSSNYTIPIIFSSVLKDSTGKKRSGELSTLQYLFEFLDAYDFSSEGSEDIQEENKTLINASVLGLIFEKINGYKDGSFFTPGFITMYMCRETIRRAVVQKFNEAMVGASRTSVPDMKTAVSEALEDTAIKFSTFDDVYNAIGEDSRAIFSTKEANNIINSLKICDPAVGSGHFLVSALNEIIAIKNDLGVLLDREGKRLKQYYFEVVNDELIVTDEDGELFEYNPTHKESQRVQEALFHEKQTIIENCLFGVDINPNSVKICRLRLWIELLKNAYYKSSCRSERSEESQASKNQMLHAVQHDTRELETLPNIDINIKCGNSLISRFSLDADLKQTLKKSKWSIDMYRVAVQTYRNAKSREEKHGMEKLMRDIKADFRSEISANSKEVKDLQKWRGELFNLTNQNSLFELNPIEKVDLEKKVNELSDKILKQEALIEEVKNNVIFENAFEWRFEFPEVLNDEGDFMGFDVCIGNPPYIRQEEFSNIKPYLKTNYEIYHSIADLLTYFVELGFKIIKSNGLFKFIISNKFTKANYGKVMRGFLTHKTNLTHFIDFNGVSVFDEASVDAAIIGYQKVLSPNNTFIFAQVSKFDINIPHFQKFIKTIQKNFLQNSLSDEAWTFLSPHIQAIKQKMEDKGTALKDWNVTLYRGILTGLNEAFIIDEYTKNHLLSKDENCKQFIKPILRGRDIYKFYPLFQNLWLINIPKGYTIKTKLKIIDAVEEPIPRYGYVKYDEAWEWFKRKHPAVSEHLLPFKNKANKRTDMGDYWWELRACSYLNNFEKPKIIYKDIAQKLTFCYDETGFYTNNTNYFITGDVNLKYILGLLNSKLIDYYYRLNSTQLGENAVRLFTQFVEKIPLINADHETQNKIATLSSEILDIKKTNFNSDVSDLEYKIDQLVYELYGLTEEEIAIVESH